MASHLRLSLITLILLISIAFIFTMSEQRVEKAMVVNAIETSTPGKHLVDLKLPSKDEVITIQLDRTNIKVGDEILLKVNKTTSEIKTLQAEKIEILGIIISFILIILIGIIDSKSYNHGIKILG